MRKLDATEKAVLILAVALITGGAFIVWRPAEGVFFPPSNSEVPIRIRSQPEQVSKAKSRLGGGLAILVGIAIGTLVLYREHK
jgi:hypothetical protein